jgi:hypothetical protein
MLADPQTLTVNSVAKVMPRVNQDNNGSKYRLRSTTDEYVLEIKHSDGKIAKGQLGEGHVVKVTYTLFATSSTPEYVTTMWTSFQNPDGLDLTTVKNILLALAAYLTGANIDKFLNGES